MVGSVIISCPRRCCAIPGSTDPFFYFGSESAPDEIVIAFRGTDGDMFLPAVADWTLGNIPAAFGYEWVEVFDAIRLVADTMAEYPGVPITFTGHLLGVGLASLMSVFFGVEAFTFDSAPFELSGLSILSIPLPIGANWHDVSSAMY